MTDAIEKLVLHLAEEEDFTDEDSDLVKDVESFSEFNEVSEWLTNNLPKLGFTADGHRRWWVKVTSNEDRRVRIGVSTEPGKTFMVLYLPNGPSWYSDKMETVDSGKPVIDKLREWGIISVAEAQEDFGDEDADLVKDVSVDNFNSQPEIDEWMKSALPKHGFVYQSVGARAWEKGRGNTLVGVGASTRPGCVLLIRYERTLGNRWRNEEMFSVEAGLPALLQLKKWGIISVAESEFEDEDDFLIRDTASIAPSDVEAGLVRVGFEKEEGVWVKRMKKRAVTVALVPNSYYVISCYRRGETGWIFSHRWESNLAGMEDYLNRFKPGAVEENQEDEDFGDEEAFEMKDVLGPEEKHEIYTFVKTGRMELSGSVGRSDRHYVHENTTRVELNAEYPTSWNPTEEEVENRNFIQAKMDPEVDKLEKEINENLYRWNRQIYKELEVAYNDYTSEEQVAENIKANDYTFDESGKFNRGELTYDQLDPRAQEKAREWWVQSMLENGETFYSESVVAEWKWLLKNKGFNGVDIAWSGFWSQGDGASFTCKSIDFEKYFTGPDPIEFPQQERDQLWENEEDEDLDPRDVYSPDRKNIDHLRTKTDYAEYQQRVTDFFARQGINSLFPVSDEDNNWISHGFRKSPCDVCHRPLAGERVEASGFNPTTKEVQVYDNVCQDCLYYTQFGQLDDQTMMDLKDEPVTEAEEEGLDDDIAFKDVEIDNPTHGMPVGRDKIHSQPATQYYEKFPNNAWEIFVVRPAKPTKKDPRDYRSVFIGILIRTPEGWHQINRNNDSWIGPAHQTPSEVAQMMFDANKEYVWRHLGSMVTNKR